MNGEHPKNGNIYSFKANNFSLYRRKVFFYYFIWFLHFLHFCGAQLWHRPHPSGAAPETRWCQSSCCQWPGRVAECSHGAGGESYLKTSWTCCLYFFICLYIYIYINGYIYIYGYIYMVIIYIYIYGYLWCFYHRWIVAIGLYIKKIYIYILCCRVTPTYLHIYFM